MLQDTVRQPLGHFLDLSRDEVPVLLGAILHMVKQGSLGYGLVHKTVLCVIHDIIVQIELNSLRDAFQGSYILSKALSNNPAHIEQLCSLLELGSPVGPVTRVPGGFHHCMWRMETENDCFAFKHLADDTDTGNAAIVR